jgi:hypothetical protein
MLRRAIAGLALVTVVVLAAAAAPASAAPTIVADCTPAPADCTGWYRTNVSVDWTVLPAPPTAAPTPGTCVDTTLTADSAGAYQVCSAVWNGRATVELWVRIDKTPPTVTGGAPARAPDMNGWYRSPVRVDFRGSDATSGIRACGATTYAGPDGAGAHVNGTCTDVAGNTSPAFGFPLRYDATGPRVTRGWPLRRPDYRRWYNHPVRWRFRGRDRLSGLQACPSVLYTGPDSRDAHVAGACSDRAGNVSIRGFPLRYDATPPPAPLVKPISHDRSVRLKIAAGAGTRRMAIVRAPGFGGDRDSTIYSGRPRSFTDRRVRNGRRYVYTVLARDRAGNRSRTTVGATPNARLLSPADGAAVAALPLLRWTPVRGADYYNVQLRRDGRKVLSTWPSRPRLQLRQRWRFDGHVRRLVAAGYRWDVWPGFGPRSRARFGSRIGGRSFVVTAAPPAQ